MAAIDRRNPAVFVWGLLACRLAPPDPQCIAGMTSVWALDFDFFKVSTACQILQKLSVVLCLALLLRWFYTCSQY